MQTTKKIEWAGGHNGTGYITDWKPAAKDAKYPDVGTALYVATRKDGKIAWSERRAYHIDRARKDGLI